MTTARRQQVIDRWHLAGDGAQYTPPAQPEALGEESEPQPFNNRKPLAQ